MCHMTSCDWLTPKKSLALLSLQYAVSILPYASASTCTPCRTQPRLSQMADQVHCMTENTHGVIYPEENKGLNTQHQGLNTQKRQGVKYPGEHQGLNTKWEAKGLMRDKGLMWILGTRVLTRLRSLSRKSIASVVSPKSTKCPTTTPTWPESGGRGEREFREA